MYGIGFCWTPSRQSNMARRVNLLTMGLLAAAAHVLHNLHVGHLAWPVTKAQGPMADTPRSRGSDRCARGGARCGGNLVDTAVAAGKFGTLTAALTKTELVDALKGDGPFTVFPPTDDVLTTALEALGVTAEELLARDDWADTVKYHVIPVAKVMGTDSEAGEQKEGCRQGVIHIIYMVLRPPSSLADMVDTAVAAGKFGTLAAALTKAKLVDALKDDGPFH